MRNGTAGPTDRPVVAHFVYPYLFRTGSWIYAQIVNLARVKPIVVTERVENLDIFPFEAVFAYGALSRLDKVWLCLRYGRRGAYWLFHEVVLRRERVDIMHAHLGGCGVALLELKRQVGLPLVTAFYGVDASREARDTVWRDAYHRLFEEGDLFLAEGPFMRETLIALGCPQEKVVVQHLGVEVEKEPFVIRQPHADGSVQVLVAGRFTEKKGIPDALRAIGSVRQRWPSVKVTVIGDADGTEREQREKARILDALNRLGSAATWLGFQPYPVFRVALLTHHLFVSASRTAADGDTEGGSPVSITEAQATGMPVVATEHADIPEVVRHGVTGLLGPEGDIDALARNIEALVSDPGLWERMGRAARAHVEREYNARRQARRLERLYEVVLQANGSRRGGPE